MHNIFGTIFGIYNPPPISAFLGDHTVFSKDQGTLRGVRAVRAVPRSRVRVVAEGRVILGFDDATSLGEKGGILSADNLALRLPTFVSSCE